MNKTSLQHWIFRVACRPSAPLAMVGLTLAASSGHAALTASGTYDEQTVQANAVDFSMGYSANATWTTGIGQSLGASQILDYSTFKTLVEGAFATGTGGVVDFDNGGTLDSSISFNVSFDSGSKSLGFTNRSANGGSYSLNTSTSNRTPISGDTYLGRSTSPHYDFDLTELSGFATDEKVTAVGVTLLGRNGGSTGTSNWRVIGYYTDGVNTGSSSTFRSIDTASGNTTADSFSGIVAPAGYWITRIRVHSDNNVYTSIDDLAFVTTTVQIPAQLTWQGGVGGNVWDVGITTNWIEGVTPTVFANGDAVTFNDSGTGPAVNLVGDLSPSSTLVDAFNPYTFQGAGRLTGNASLVKAGTGSLTLATTNDHTGPVTISNGVVRVENSEALGGGNLAFRGAIGIQRAILGLTPGSGDFLRPVGGGAGQVSWPSGAGGFAAYGGDRAVDFGGTAASVTWTAAGVFGNGLMLGAPDADSVVTVVNPVNLNNAQREIEVEDGSPVVDAVMAGAFTQGGASGALYKRGNGTLALTADTTAVIPINVGEGVLQIGLGGTNGHPGGGELTVGTTLRFNRSDTLELTNAISPFGAGTIEQVGTGTTVLSGQSSFAGSTLVSNGRLMTTTANTGGGSVTVADGTTFGVRVGSAGTSASLSALTLGAVAGCTLKFDAGSFGNPIAPIISVSGLLAANGTVTIDLAGSGFTPGTFTLIQYFGGTSGTRSFALGTVNPLLGSVSINDDTVNGLVTLTIGTVADASLVWVGDGAASWDINNAANLVWLGVPSSLPAYYRQNLYGANGVTFNDTAIGSTSVTLVGTLTPASVTVANSSKNYSFGGAGRISGGTGLDKNGSGTLTVSTPNDYLGDTTVSAGTLKLAASEVLPDGSGRGSLVLDGTLDVAGFAETVNSLTGAGTVDNSTGSGLLTVGAGDQDFTFGGLIQNTAGTLALGKAGTGTLTLTNANTYSGGTTIGRGRINIQDSTALGTGTVTIQTNDSSVNQLVLGAPGLAVSNSLILNGGGVVGQGAVHYNQSSGSALWWGPITVAGPTQAGGHFATASTAAELVVGGPITALTNVSVRAGTVTLSNSANSLELVVVAEGVLKVGVPGALPAAAGVVVGDTANNNSRAALDLNGINQELAALTENQRGTGSTSLVTNSAAAPATLSLNIVFDTTNTYDGSIVGDLGLVKKGLGVAELTAASTYTNATVIEAGTLRLNPGGNGGNPATGMLDGTALISVSGGATLDLLGNNAISGFGGGPRDLTVNGGVVNFNSGNHQVATLILNGGDLQSSLTPSVFGSVGLNSNLTVTADSMISALNVDLNDAVRTFDVAGGRTLDVIGSFKGYSLGSTNTPNTLAGLVKLGEGTMVLGAGNTHGYHGPTTVSNGILRVNGSLPNSVVEVFGGTLGGEGDLGRAVTLYAGTTLSAGSSIGILTINNNVTFAGDVLVELNKSMNPSNDLVSVSGFLINAGAGALIISNQGPALATGDRFQIFNKAVVAGATLSLVSTEPGVVWTNNLAVDGSIEVLSAPGVAAPPNFPPGAVVRLPDGSIALTATGALGATYQLWATTNVALTPVADTWTLLTNGTLTASPFSIVDPAATNLPRRFYIFSSP